MIYLEDQWLSRYSIFYLNGLDGRTLLITFIELL